MTLVNSRMVRGRCPCGVEHAACGPPSTCTPVDENLEVAVVGGALKKYKVVTAGGVETVMKLNDSDAARYGVALGEPEPEAQSAEEGKPEPQAKKRVASNKSRTAATKDGGTDGADG